MTNSLKISAVVNTVNPARPLLARAQGRWASIVNLNAVLAHRPNPDLIATSALRAALLNLSASMAKELAPEGIRVNSVSVGQIETGQTERHYAASGSTETYDRWLQQRADQSGIPLGRLGTASEVANLIVFLLSDRASYLTGTPINIDGGLTCQV